MCTALMAPRRPSPPSTHTAGRMAASLATAGQRPNGSRLSCGRDGRGRNEAERATEVAGAATQFFLTFARPPASNACYAATPGLHLASFDLPPLKTRRRAG